MVANAVFYTFSTIAQTLAGAIALLGAFVLYRLQSLTGDIEDESRSVAGKYDLDAPGYDQSHQRAIHGLHDERRYRAVLEFAARTPPPPTVDQATTARARLRLHLDQKDSLSKTLAVSLCLTVGLILLSVLALVATPSIVACKMGPTLLFGAGVTWFIACMLSYAVLIRKALQ